MLCEVCGSREIGKIVNLEGKRFGKLAVRSFVTVKNHYAYWLCECDCGNEVEVKSTYLLKGETKSCGCLAKSSKNIKHGLKNHRLYRTWKHMKERCNNPNIEKYHCYGGRGIKVCEDWANNFKKFYDWAMENGYQDNLEIDRIDVDGNYEPINCRWVTRREQMLNRRNTLFTIFNGEKITINELAQKYNIRYGTIAYRAKQGKTGMDLIKKKVANK